MNTMEIFNTSHFYINLKSSIIINSNNIIYFELYFVQSTKCASVRVREMIATGGRVRYKRYSSNKFSRY